MRNIIMRQGKNVMKRAKKILSVLLICMVSMMAFPAVTYGATRVAQPGRKLGNPRGLQQKHLHGSSHITDPRQNLVIPSKIDGLKVTALEMGLSDRKPFRKPLGEPPRPCHSKSAFYCKIHRIRHLCQSSKFKKRGYPDIRYDLRNGPV